MELEGHEYAFHFHPFSLVIESPPDDQRVRLVAGHVQQCHVFRARPEDGLRSERPCERAEASPPIIGQMTSGAEEEPRVFRAGGVSYLRIPAEDPRRSAAFYKTVFGWNVRGDREDPSFEDGTWHVIGHFVADLPVAGEASVRPFVLVERIDETLERVVAHGGEVVTSPYPEGDLVVGDVPGPARDDEFSSRDPSLQ
jgi:uncharacterized protein